MMMPVSPSTLHAGGPAVISSEGVAISGIDPVSYFAKGRAVTGSDAFRLIWHNVIWHFEDASTQSTFESDPHKFAPRYGGYCAFSMSEGVVSRTDPDAWAIHDGRLYLAQSLAAIVAWKKAPAAFTERADAHWPSALCS